MQWTCSNCGSKIQVRSEPKLVFCKCGFVDRCPVFVESNEAENQAPSPVRKTKTSSSPTQTCVHRGQQIGTYLCRPCDGSQPVYACEIHGRCAKSRKTPEGDQTITLSSGRTIVSELAFCRKCCDFSEATEPNSIEPSEVCFLWPFFSTHGGVETWHRTLVPRLGRSCVLATQKRNYCDVSEIHRNHVNGNHRTRLAVAQSRVVVAAAIPNLKWMLPQENKPRVIYVDHGDGSIEYFAKLFHWNREVVDTFVCVDAKVAENYRQWHHDVRVIQNGIDPDRIPSHRKTQPRTVAWIHRQAEEKQPELAYAIAEALPAGWQMLVSFAGTDTDKVKHIGSMSNPRSIYEIASVFLSTSFSDGFGLSCAEAMASGIPVVSTPVGICADPQLATQVAFDATIDDWVQAILQAEGSDATQAQTIVQSRYGVDAFVRQWQEVLDR